MKKEKINEVLMKMPDGNIIKVLSTKTKNITIYKTFNQHQAWDKKESKKIVGKAEKFSQFMPFV